VTAASCGARRHAEPAYQPSAERDSHGADRHIQADKGFSGHIRTLALDAKLILVPVAKSDVENAPDYRIHLGDDDGSAIGPEVGAGWKRNGEKAGDYVSLHLDGPTLRQPIRANLFQADDQGTAFNLLWNRPPRRNETA
jgi:uncharacterized protein (DUF736 family)